MGSAGLAQLDPEFLGKEAKATALDVAAERQLYLAPEALPAIDVMIKERKEPIERNWRNLETWKKHVRHISINVARRFESRGTKRITKPEELLETSRPIFSVYPYD